MNDKDTFFGIMVLNDLETFKKQVTPLLQNVMIHGWMTCRKGAICSICTVVIKNARILIVSVTLHETAR
jgi:ferredoxin